MDELEEFANGLSHPQSAVPVNRVGQPRMNLNFQTNVRRRFNPLVWACALLVLLVCTYFGWAFYEMMPAFHKNIVNAKAEAERDVQLSREFPGGLFGPSAILSALHEATPDKIADVNTESGDLTEKHLVFSTAGVCVVVRPNESSRWEIADTTDLRSGKSINMAGAASRIIVVTKP